MVNFGDVGTGQKDVIVLKQEPTWASTITNCAPIYLRPLSTQISTTPAFIQGTPIDTNELGWVKKVAESTMGMQGFEVDMLTLPRLLGAIMGSLSSADNDSARKHTIKFGTDQKSFKAFTDEGGLSTPLYLNYLGLVLNRLALKLSLSSWLGGEYGVLGKSDETGSNPLATISITGVSKAAKAVVTKTAHGLLNGTIVKMGTVTNMPEIANLISPITKIDADTFSLDWINSSGFVAVGTTGTMIYAHALDNMRVAYGGLTIETDTVGGSEYTAWIDPFDFNFEVGFPDARADDVRPDGSGKTHSINLGTPMIMLSFNAQLTTTHLITAFRAATEKAIRVTLDTGVVIPGGGTTTYKAVITIPYAVLQSYTRNRNSSGVIQAGIQVLPEKSPSATYSVMIEIYNDILSYPDST